MSDVAAVVAVGLGTYLTRASFILLFAHRELPPLLRRAVRNVGPAVLAALVASLLVGEEGITALTPSVELGALALGAIAAWRTTNMMVGLTVGMVALWVLSAIF